MIVKRRFDPTDPKPEKDHEELAESRSLSSTLADSNYHSGVAQQ